MQKLCSFFFLTHMRIEIVTVLQIFGVNWRLISYFEHLLLISCILLCSNFGSWSALGGKGGQVTMGSAGRDRRVRSQLKSCPLQSGQLSNPDPSTSLPNPETFILRARE